MSPHDELVELVPNIWLDFQQMAAFEKNPFIVTGGRGVFAETSDGRRLFDGISGAAVCSLGYHDRAVAEAMKKQLDSYLFSPPLHGTNEPALRLAAKLAEVLPEGLNRAFLLSGGSEATEAAMKMARQYHRQSGDPRKYKVISRNWSYHGSTMGALSASGVPDKRMFGPYLSGYLHGPAPYPYRDRVGGETVEDYELRMVNEIESLIRYEGPETVSAVIVDPVLAAAGILVPTAAYYHRLREICDEYDVLLIFDEVLTGFGRLGEWFAADYYGVVPDIICLAKGMSSGYIPLAATVASDRVAEAFLGAPEDGVQFVHGNTYGGNPLAAAAGCAIIGQIQERNLIGNASDVGGYLGERLAEEGEQSEFVGDVRGAGLLWGLEFVKDKTTKEQFEREDALAPLVTKLAMEEESLIVRSNLHILQVSPPLITTKDEVDDLVGRLFSAIRNASKNARVEA